MEEILFDADREGATMALTIAPSDGLSFEQLKAWYERLGFGIINSEAGIMIRPPVGLVGSNPRLTIRGERHGIRQDV